MLPLSFEFYPPKTDDQRSQLDRTAKKLAAHAPEYVSCTFGAGGSTLSHTPETVRRFLVGPVECEITGIAITPDGKTMFCNVQHPGEDGSIAAPTRAEPAAGTTSSKAFSDTSQ